MFQRKQRRFRHRPSPRDHRMLHGNGNAQTRLGSNVFSNGQTRNNFRTHLSAEKLFEKYNSLAKESMLSGDKTLSENYLQHADHFMRIIEDKNKNRNQNKVNFTDKPVQDNKHLSDNDDINQGNEIKNKD